MSPPQKQLRRIHDSFNQNLIFDLNPFFLGHLLLSRDFNLAMDLRETGFAGDIRKVQESSNL